MQIESLTPESQSASFDEIAALHIGQIHHGTLPLLGARFLSRLYRELTRAPHTGVWIARDAGHVVGFLAGCADVSACYRSVFSQSVLPLGLLALRALFVPATLGKVPAVLLYPWRSNAHAEPSGSGERESRAELLAVAVRPEAQGRGVGRALVLAFETSLRSWAARTYYVSTNIAETGSNAFYRSLGFEAQGTMPHQDLVLQCYRRCFR